VLTSDCQLFLAFAVEIAGADAKILPCILGGFFAMRVAHVYAPPQTRFPHPLHVGEGRLTEMLCTMTRDDKTYPSEHEASSAAWLAKPDMQGGLVIALLQPAKTQIYTEDVQWVKNECPTLAYLKESLAFQRPRKSRDHKRLRCFSIHQRANIFGKIVKGSDGCL
jgi:hypothetical protein